MNSKSFLSLLFVIVFTLNGCVVGYRRYPAQQLKKPAPEKQFRTLYFNIEGSLVGGGHEALRETFQQESPFQTTEIRPAIPQEGLYVHAMVKPLPPSISAMIAGFFTYASLTLLPSWSTRDGGTVQFVVYNDGKILKTFQYDMRRFIAIWLGLLPFIWANTLTTNERTVFRAIGKQFFEDAKPTFESVSR